MHPHSQRTSHSDSQRVGLAVTIGHSATPIVIIKTLLHTKYKQILAYLIQLDDGVANFKSCIQLKVAVSSNPTPLCTSVAAWWTLAAAIGTKSAQCEDKAFTLRAHWQQWSVGTKHTSEWRTHAAQQESLERILHS